MKLRFTPRATSDLIVIGGYIRARNPAASLAVRDAILSSLQTLALYPEMGRRQDVEGVRKIVTRTYGYLGVRSAAPDSCPTGHASGVIFVCYATA
jgi:toxin ParE1/3/4